MFPAEQKTNKKTDRSEPWLVMMMMVPILARPLDARSKLLGYMMSREGRLDYLVLLYMPSDVGYCTEIYTRTSK